MTTIIVYSSESPLQCIFLLRSSVSGYRKEQLKVQINNYGRLRISGERPLGDNRWSRFSKDFQVAENCDVSEIRAKFEDGHLYVILPKLITEVRGQEEPARAPQKPKEERKPTSEPEPSTRQNGVTKKEEDEKRGEPMEARKEAQKVGEKEKDLTEEKKYKEEVAGVVKDEEGEKGGAVTDVQKKEARGRNGVRKLAGELVLGFYKPRKIMVNVIVAAVVLVGVGLYVTYKLRRPMEEDGH